MLLVFKCFMTWRTLAGEVKSSYGFDGLFEAVSAKNEYTSQSSLVQGFVEWRV